MSETFVQKKFSVIGMEINDSRTYGIYAGAWSFAVRQTHHNIFKEEAEETSEEETTAEGLSDEIREKMAVKEALANADTDITEDQWNLSAMHWSEDLQGSDQIRIALLDRGVSYDSDVDVAEDIRILEEDQDVDSLYIDASGHGTAMAGVIAAKNNSEGVTGVNEDVSLYSIKVLNTENQATLSTVVSGIYRAIEEDCQIINMSFGTAKDSDILHTAIRAAYDAGALMIASAGNSAGAVEYPAAYEEVMAVGSTDASGAWMSETAGSDGLEILAPGDQILTTGGFGGTLAVAGTSVAAAQVSGAASLIWAQAPNQSADFIRRLLTNTAQTVENCSAGLVDIANAVDQMDAFAECYQETEIEYPEIQESAEEAEDFGGVEIVTGSWKSSTHSDMAGDAASNYGFSSSNEYVKLMKSAAALPDKTDGGVDYTEARMLHGATNYVQSLHFLYQCASYVRAGKSSSTAISQAAEDANLDTSNEHQAQLIEKTTKLLAKTITTDSTADQTSNKGRYFKVMGFAMHCVGDTYAHRTIAPTSTVDGTNPSEPTTTMFGSSDFNTSTHTKTDDATLKKWAKNSSTYADSICRYWVCFQRAVKIGVIEFRDVSNFSTESGKTSRGHYEDNKNFCSERFDDAQTACEILMTSSYDKDDYDGIYIIYPIYGSKLNGFLYYAKKDDAENYESYSDWEDWDSWSTDSLV